MPDLDHAEHIGRMSANIDHLIEADKMRGRQLASIEHKLDEQHDTPCAALIETRASLRTTWIAITFVLGLAMYAARYLI